MNSLDRELHNEFSSIWWMRASTARWLTIPLLPLGMAAWLDLGGGQPPRLHQFWWMLGTLLFALIPPISKGFNRAWIALERPSAMQRILIAFVLTIASAIFLYITERYFRLYGNRPFFMHYTDEFGYAIQARLLGAGRLWMPQHPMWRYFESFALINVPVYASMYFPGTAMFACVFMKMGIPYYAITCGEGGCCVGLIFLVFTEILDGFSGLLAAMLLVATSIFRFHSAMFLSQVPVLMLGLAMTLCYLHWRRSGRRLWLVGLGVASGWAALTRPLDALCFAVAIGVAMLMDLWRRKPGDWVKVAAIVIVSAGPFLSIQVVFNRGVTGQWILSPFEFYTMHYFPGTEYGFHPIPPPHHVSDVPEVQLASDGSRGLVRAHQLNRLPRIFLGNLMSMNSEAIPMPLLWLIIPMSVLVLWDRKFWVVWGVAILFIFLSIGYSFFIVHYNSTAVPAYILLGVLPIRFLTDAFPFARAFARTALSGILIVLSVTALPEMDHAIHDTIAYLPEVNEINLRLQKDVAAPAVVLFHYTNQSLDAEPVYNADVAWPDDAPVIRAHDLNKHISRVGKPGDADVDLYRYYAKVAPDRVFYIYDRGTSELTRLGTARELFNKF